MIPKVIHYCWFGNGEKSELVLKCIESWRKFCPDYEIIEWNETNYDVTKNKYMREAYEEKRWGFVPDYARIDIVYQNGGIYLDTDVELVKNYDSVLHNESFFGFERAGEAYQINLGSGFGSVKGNEFLKQIRDYYENCSFINLDGTLNLTPSPIINSQTFVNSGYVLNNKLQTKFGNTVYPYDYFAPLSWVNLKGKPTKNTISIHHYNTSWLSDEEKKKRRRATIKHNIIHFPNKIVKSIMGTKRYENIKKNLKR